MRLLGIATLSGFLILSLACASRLTVKSGASQDGPYRVLATTKVGGDGGFDYVNCDPEMRRTLCCAPRAFSAGRRL